MRGRTGLALLIASGMVGWAGVAAADRASDVVTARPAFTATPAELLAAAKAAPAGDDDSDRVTLRSEEDTSFDAQSRATVRTHHIYLVRAPKPRTEGGDTEHDAADRDDDDEDDDGSASVSTVWRPSLQDRPVLRLRVVEPGGAVHELDPAKIADEVLGPSKPGATADVHLIVGRLAKPVPGSVVESEVTTHDHEPPPGGAIAWSHPRAMPGATVSYSVPVGLRLRRVERKLPAGVQAHHSVAAGRERWSYDIPAKLAADETRFEPWSPGDDAALPRIGVSTAASWAAVARAYRAVIDRRIAEGPVVLPASLPHDASRETVDAVAAWVRGRVHRAPLGFTYAPYTPQPPAVTLTRGPLSTTDTATLLVAVLRQAGIRAHLTLITSEPLGVVDPELPGLKPFDHVIVRARVANRDVWIDPAEELLPAGQLTLDAQDRSALVIADDTTGLTATPARAARDNTMHETRTFVATEHGPSAATGVVTATGALETDGRRSYSVSLGSPARRRGESNERYGGTLVRQAPSDPRDLTTPFTLSREVVGSLWVYNYGHQIVVDLPARDALYFVPEWLREKPESPRVHDFVWRMPYVFEIENRIELPPGFAPPAAAPERVVRLGAATFTERRRVDGNALVVTQRFDSGKPRWTAAEVTAMQEAMPALDAETLHIAIDRTSYALREAGKLREAAAEDARMIALHPQEALHHEHLAVLLIHAGLGDAARREARTAVQLAPSDPEALSVLGWVLHHDRVGRDFVYDWDRAGSLEALRKARAIAPTFSNAAFELATVLERDPAGELYARGADMRGATEAWTAAREKSTEPEIIALRLAEVLLWAGQPIAAETMARTVKPSAWRDLLIMAAIAQTQGAKAAIAEAGKLRAGDERRKLIGDATWWAIERRQYDLARTLFAETPGSDKLSPFWTAMLARLAVHPDTATGAPEPRAALDELFLALAEPARKTSVFFDARIETRLRGYARQVMPLPSRVAGARVLFSDMMRSASYQIDGGDGAWRAKVPGKTGPSLTPYLALDRGTIKVIGTPASFPSIGHYLLGLALGDPAVDARARRILELLRSDLDGDVEYQLGLFKRVWGSGKPTSRDAIELAAALLAGDSDRDRSVAIATRCPLTSPEARLACHAILMSAYFDRGRTADALKECEAVLAADPSLASRLLGSHARMLERLGRWADAEKLGDDYMAAHPDDSYGLVVRYQTARNRGDHAEAARRLAALSTVPKPAASELNSAAWEQLLPGGDLARGRELAKQAVELSPRAYPELNTLAVLEAELGDLGAAVRDNQDAMALQTSDEPGPADWCVVARVAEQLGQTDDAIAIYRKIARPDADPVSIAGYAARRLTALHAP
jgi:tetratricopeptide (TPR) repeat protein